MAKAEPDRAARLTAIRDRLAATIEGCGTPRDLVALAREYRLTLAELDSIGVREEADVVDQIAARRSAKSQAGTAGSA